jgi:hypothetical protein
MRHPPGKAAKLRFRQTPRKIRAVLTAEAATNRLPDSIWCNALNSPQ